MLRALIYTCLIEAAVTFARIWIRSIIRRRRLNRTDGRMVYYNLLCNMFTNPILNLSLFGAYMLGADPGTIRVLTIIGEITVVAVEYILYRLMSFEKRSFCLTLSIITNVLSYLSGFLL